MRYINFGFIFLILGSIIGAGFASGKEIEVFFSSSGKLSYLIVVLSSIFLYFTLKNLIKLGKIAKTANIKEVNKLLFKKTSKFFDKTLAAFFRKRTDFLCVSPDVLGESKGWSSDLITVDEYMSSLSAIIMDEDNYRWYEFVKGCSIN